MTTPTPPDAVREALISALRITSNGAREALWDALGLPYPVIARQEVERIADALLSRPSDARGREERIEYGAMWHEADVLTWDGDEKEARWYIDACKKEHPEGKHPTLVQRTVTTTDWTPLSPTQEGA